MTTPIFVAEVSSNHNRNLDRCIAFIDTAADIGCDAVKFQLFSIDELFAPEIIANHEHVQKRKDWELPEDYLPILSKHSQQRNINFACTPFHLNAVQTLVPFVDFFKIASYELLWDNLLKTCAMTGKPIVLSTGMATINEIAHAVRVLRQSGCQKLTLLHCVSAYPTPYKQCNLAVLQTLRNHFACPVGWSDHSVDPAVILRAVNTWSAAMIEFHLDLDGCGAEFGAQHCWLPDAIANVIRMTRIGIAADGHMQKQPSPCEISDREWRADPVDGLRPLLQMRKQN